MEKKFIGKKRIAYIEDTEVGMVKVYFNDESWEEMPRVMFEHSSSENGLDATELRNKRVEPVVKDILEVIVKWNLKLEELDYMFNLLKVSLDENLKNAEEKLWGRKLYDRTIRDIDFTLKGIKLVEFKEFKPSKESLFSKLWKKIR